jgi:hypothetical protein
MQMHHNRETVYVKSIPQSQNQIHSQPQKDMMRFLEVKQGGNERFVRSNAVTKYDWFSCMMRFS